VCGHRVHSLGEKKGEGTGKTNRPADTNLRRRALMPARENAASGIDRKKEKSSN